MNTLLESITFTKYGQFEIRCWREEDSYDGLVAENTRHSINEWIRTETLKKEEAWTPHSLATSLLQMNRMNAVEVKELHGAKAGCVLYKLGPNGEF